jgi:hypothetical protein
VQDVQRGLRPAPSVAGLDARSGPDEQARRDGQAELHEFEVRIFDDDEAEVAVGRSARSCAGPTART